MRLFFKSLWIRVIFQKSTLSSTGLSLPSDLKATFPNKFYKSFYTNFMIGSRDYVFKDFSPKIICPVQVFFIQLWNTEQTFSVYLNFYHFLFISNLFIASSNVILNFIRECININLKFMILTFFQD